MFENNFADFLVKVSPLYLYLKVKQHNDMEMRLLNFRHTADTNMCIIHLSLLNINENVRYEV